jgi:hypothetical protein
MERDHIKEVLLKYGQEVVIKMAKVLTDTKLKDKLKPVIIEDKDSVALGIEMPAYAQWVNDGRSPFGIDVASKDMYKAPHNTYPPKKEIDEWIKDKKIPQFRIQKEWSSAGNKGGRWLSNETRSFLIRRSIAVRGIKPRPFMNLLFDNIKDLNKELGSAVAADYANTLQILMNEKDVGE